MTHPAPSEILTVHKERLKLQRKADLLEQQEKAMLNSLIEHMSVNGIDVYNEGENQVEMVVTDEPTATDWPKILDYIVEEGATDLLQKRLTASAVKKRWDDGLAIPGVMKTQKKSLKFNV